jgi:hypothetical protein
VQTCDGIVLAARLERRCLRSDDLQLSGSAEFFPARLKLSVNIICDII